MLISRVLTSRGQPFLNLEARIELRDSTTGLRHHSPGLLFPVLSEGVLDRDFALSSDSWRHQIGDVLRILHVGLCLRSTVLGS